MQAVTATITAPAEGLYRVHVANGVHDFRDLEAAADRAIHEAASLAESQARQSRFSRWGIWLGALSLAAIAASLLFWLRHLRGQGSN